MALAMGPEELDGELDEELKNLIRKYSTSGPRYTSYPTAPHWSDTVGASHYETVLKSLDEKKGPLALYAHIPFCEALCYYCGCNILITKEKNRARGYVDSLIKEISWVASKISGRQALSQISWGGGTPTFLASEEIKRLFQGITACFDLTSDAEVSIEIDPRVTSDEQLVQLRELGFNRVSLGVQDFNLEVQKVVNRLQSSEMTEQMLRRARSLGFSGINFDLIYGLPLQTLETFNQTVDEVVRIRPDRIALYNYAHLPSLRPHQKILEKMPMPQAEERIDIFTKAYEKLTTAGYLAIGMDHFALPTDELALALPRGALYRNFMGYTVKRGAGMIGIGASAIGEAGGHYFQNIRETKEYETAVKLSGNAVFRGCELTEEDKKRQWVIQSLMCQFKLNPELYEIQFQEKMAIHFSSELEGMKAFVDEGLLTTDGGGFRVTEMGRLFLRNIAMTFDEYLKKTTTATYSRTV